MSDGFKCQALAGAMAVISLLGAASTAVAANHLDTPTVIADPRADIGDVFAWIAPDGAHLNLVMTIVGHAFSDKLDYVFHVDSGPRFGATTHTVAIQCRFNDKRAIDCHAGNIDRAVGDASATKGLRSQHGRFLVFAGLRDDPFFNNVKGFREGYQLATTALLDGAQHDEAGCPRFSAATSQAITERWRHTDGGPGKNFLNGWTPSSLVISIELPMVTKGGSMLAIWAATSSAEEQLDRMGRPLTENALLGTLEPDHIADALKERFNALKPATSAEFIAPIEEGLRLYDGFDASCGNQLLASSSSPSQSRYRALATLLADDRLWVNSTTSVCKQFFAVELAHLAGRTDLREDCGGRTVTSDAIDVYRSLLVNGTPSGVSDGVDRDEKEHSNSEFPFLAPVDPAAADRKY